MIPKQMAAVQLTGYGGLDRLQYRTDVPVPQPGAGEVLVRVTAAGMNNTGINTRTGWYNSGVGDGMTQAGWRALASTRAAWATGPATSAFRASRAQTVWAASPLWARALTRPVSESAWSAHPISVIPTTRSGLKTQVFWAPNMTGPSLCSPDCLRATPCGWRMICLLPTRSSRRCPVPAGRR